MMNLFFSHVDLAIYVNQHSLSNLFSVDNVSPANYDAK